MRAKPEPESAQLTLQMCLGFILRGLGLFVVNTRAKRTQLAQAA